MILIAALILNIFTYKQAALMNINQGVIGSLFAMSTIFTTIMFFFIFGQRLEPVYFIGITFMMTCVVLISFSKESSSGRLEQGSSSEDMVYIISLALFTAVTFSLISLVTKAWYVKYKYEAINFGVDSMFLFGLTLLPFCIKY